jgi:hypothetical protein
LIGPAFGTLLASASEGTMRELIHYQTAFSPLLLVVALAIILAFYLRETGPASNSSAQPKPTTLNTFQYHPKSSGNRQPD